VQMLQCFVKPVGAAFTLPRQGGLQRYVWPWDAAEFLAACDLLGYGDYVAKSIDFYFEHCVRPSGEAGPFKNRWAADTACVLRSFSLHCLETGDADFWRKHRDRAEASFRWIRARRCADGLFPAMKSTDSTAKAMRHWGMTDLQNIFGLDCYVRAAERFSDPILSEARAERADYRAAVTRVLDRWREVSRGLDTLFLPIASDAENEMSLRRANFSYTHCCYFAKSGLLSGDECRRLWKWCLDYGYANENGLCLRQSSKWASFYRHVWYTTAQEFAWFEAWKREGREDLADKVMKASLRFAVTDEGYVAERYHDANPWYYPWSPNASGAGRIVQMLYWNRPAMGNR